MAVGRQARGREAISRCQGLRIVGGLRSARRADAGGGARPRRTGPARGGYPRDELATGAARRRDHDRVDPQRGLAARALGRSDEADGLAGRR